MTSTTPMRRLLRALFGALLCVVTLVGIARAGTTYLYCSMAGTIGEAPCCKHGHADDADPMFRAPEMECCRSHALPPLPAAERGGSHPAAPEARVTALLPEPPLPVVLAPAAPPARVTHARAGPRPPAYASDARASLMIFLC